MSRVNVEMTRRGFELWNIAMGGDDEESRRSALGQMVESYHPDAELDFRRTLPDFAVTRGREAMISWTEGAREVLGAVRLEPLEYVDAGDAVVVRVRIDAQGASSGASTGAEFVYVFRFRAQQVIAATTYATRAEALKAAGLAG
jgi:ketosteroid isomerase-like protein